MRNIFTLSLLLLVQILQAQDGQLDNNFSGDGRETALVGNVNVTNKQRLIIIPGTDSILQTFSVLSGAENDFGIAKFDEDGNLALAFGGTNTGYSIADFGGDDQAKYAVRQTDGKIVVVGTSYIAGNGAYAVARFNSDGTLDASFGGGDGMVRFNIGTDDLANAVVLQPDGKIVVAGSSGTAGVYSLSIARLNTDGSQDLTFGTNGERITTVNGLDVINSLVYQTGTDMIIAGGYTYDGDADFVLARYNLSGNLDNTFGTGGITTTDFGALRDDVINSIAINGTGKIIAAGYTDNGAAATTDNDFALAQYTINGILDTGNFGPGTGRVTTDFGGNDVGQELELQADNRIILLGSTSTGPFPGTNHDFAIARYTTSGTLDTSFGIANSGMNTIDFSSSSDQGLSMALGDGYIMTGGISDAGGSVLALARLVNNSLPLPLRLLSFTGSMIDGKNHLEWKTSAEENTLLFEVLRSQNGNEFVIIGRVQAAGHSSATLRYAFTDANPPAGVNFYRLRMVNTNGSSVFSPIVVLRPEGKQFLQLFPNPVYTQLNIQFTQPAGPVKIEVFDAGGRMVSTISMQSSGNPVSTTLDMQKLQRGIYFISVNGKAASVIKK